MPRFRELGVWQKAHRLTLAVYGDTAGFPRDEVYGLTGQMRRCSASIAANIAEESGRGSDADLARFLHIALGSANELEYHLLLAHDLGFLDDTRHNALTADATELQRMLATFIHRLKPPANS